MTIMKKKPVVIITGASRGIGKETARKFARHGYNLTLAARGKERLESLARDLSEAGAETLVCAGDLHDPEFAHSIITRTADKWKRIDALVNNAAWRTIETMRTISLDNWERTLRISLTIPAFLAKWSAAHMEQAGKGVIVNISSIMSHNVGGYSPAYVCCKGAMESLTFELASLYGPKGIRVVCVNPGSVDTEMSTDYKNEEGENVSQTLNTHVNDMIPLGRAGAPAEVANAIFWLCSEEASYIHGAILTIDGGRSHNFTGYATKRMMFPKEF